MVALGALVLAGGCSLVVDTNGLSGGAAPGTTDGGPPANDGGLPPEGGTPESGTRETGAPDCPSKAGPPMVRIRDSHGTFCIDATEVTNAQFNAMIEAAPSTLPPRPSVCNFKGALTVTKVAAANQPRVNVDWCDAHMFCAWAGKRLCGSRDGSKIDSAAAANKAGVDEWYAACSKDGAQKYPYSGSYDDKKCNGCTRTSSCGAAGGSPLVDVGSLAGCEGGYPGLFDMAGNAREWMDDCDGDGAGDHARDYCPAKGGDRTNGNPDHIACVFVDNGNLERRGDASDRIGFRCCAN